MAADIWQRSTTRNGRAEAVEVLWRRWTRWNGAVLTQSDPLTGFCRFVSRAAITGAFKNDYLTPKSCLSARRIKAFWLPMRKRSRR